MAMRSISDCAVRQLVLDRVGTISRAATLASAMPTYDAIARSARAFPGSERVGPRARHDEHADSAVRPPPWGESHALAHRVSRSPAWFAGNADEALLVVAEAGGRSPSAGRPRPRDAPVYGEVPPSYPVTSRIGGSGRNVATLPRAGSSVSWDPCGRARLASTPSAVRLRTDLAPERGPGASEPLARRDHTPGLTDPRPRAHDHRHDRDQRGQVAPPP
jgi:hypothetical protein